MSKRYIAGLLSAGIGQRWPAREIMLSYTGTAAQFGCMDNERDELSYIMLLFLLAGAFVHGILSGLMAL